MSVPVPSTPTNPAPQPGDRVRVSYETVVDAHGWHLGKGHVKRESAENARVEVIASVSDQTPATPDDSHGVRRLIVHPAAWDGLVRFLDVRGIEVTPYPDEDGIPTFGMGIKWLPLPSSVQTPTTSDDAAARHMAEVTRHPRFAELYAQAAHNVHARDNHDQGDERAEAAVPAVHAEWDADGDFRSADCLAKGCPLCVSSDWAKRQAPSSVQGDTTAATSASSEGDHHA